MATLSTKLPAPPQSSWPEMPPEWRRWFMVVDSMIRGLNAYAVDYSELPEAQTDDLAERLATRMQSKRFISRVMSFADVSLTAPPGGETDGALYFVRGTGTGAWATYDNQAMLYDAGAYTALGTLEPGQLAWDESTEIMYRAGNDGTLSELAATAQATVNAIQADSVALADLNTTIRQSDEWIQFQQATLGASVITITRPSGWTSFKYIGSAWDNALPAAVWASGTSSSATVSISIGGSAAYASNNNRYLLIRVS